MGIPSPSSARLTVVHYQDGRSHVLLDGKPIPGVVSHSITQKHGERSELNIKIAGMAFRQETSPHKRYSDGAKDDLTDTKQS